MPHQSRAIERFRAWYRADLLKAARRILRGHPHGMSLSDLATALEESPHGLSSYLRDAPGVVLERRHHPGEHTTLWISAHPSVEDKGTVVDDQRLG